MVSNAGVPLCASKEAFVQVINALLKITAEECFKRTDADAIVVLLMKQYPQLSEDDASHLTEKVSHHFTSWIFHLYKKVG